jgi:RNA polymerase sigma-70 factor, ECF subfamily
MTTTPVSLLERLRKPPDQEAWRRFVALYTPLLHFWVRQTGFSNTEADDLVQDVFAALVQKMPAFAYDKDRSFRSWLRTVAVNKWREIKRRRTIAPSPLPETPLVDSNLPDPAEQFWEDEFRRQLLQRALRLMQRDFPEKTWQACWAVVVEGKATADVAAELGMTVGAVHAARFRVLTRLREEMAGMMD